VQFMARIIRAAKLEPRLYEEIATVWMLIAAVIAVRQALDYTSTVRAAGVCIPGWLVHVFLLFFLLLLLG
jgi:hypothetical protein